MSVAQIPATAIRTSASPSRRGMGTSANCNLSPSKRNAFITDVDKAITRRFQGRRISHIAAAGAETQRQRQRDRGTRRQGDRETGGQRGSERDIFPPLLLFSLSPCLPVPLSPCLLISAPAVSPWQSLCLTFTILAF